MKRKVLFILLTLTVSFSFYDLPPAYSQDDVFTLEEVTVTATKREKNLQDVAISATSVDGETAVKTGRTTLEQILRDTAGVEFRGSMMESSIYIRGVGANSAGMGVEMNVAISTNGMFSTPHQASQGSYYDVARIEVTRGPDSTLNGRTASGGTINVITNEPTHSFEGMGSIQYGSYNLFETQGVINVPIGEKFALRGAFLSAKRDGILTNGQNNIDNFGGRFRVMYEPNDDLKIILTAERNKTDGTRGVTAKTTPIDLTKPFTTPHGAFYNPVEAPFYNHMTSTNYYANITYDFGWASLYIQPADQHTEIGIGIFNPVWLPGDDTIDLWIGEFHAHEQNQKSFEVRLTSPGEKKLTWLAGYYYVDFEEMVTIMFRPPMPSFPEVQYPKITDASPIRSTTDNSVYGQVTYNFTDTFSIDFGGRYTKDDKWRPWATSSMYYYYLDDGIPNSLTGERVFYDTPEGSVSTDRWDYKVSLQKKLTPETMVYALVSTGFKGGGFNFVPADETLLAPGYTTFYSPEYLTSYEIGSKNQLLNNTLRLNASAFYYDYKDIQFSFNGPAIAASAGVDPDFARAVIQNAGISQHYGAEIEADWLVTRKDRVGINISYLKAEFDEMAFEPLYYLAGTEMPNSPSWRLTPRYQHSFDLGSNGELVAEIDGSYVSKTIYRVPNQPVSPYNEKDSYFKGNATLSYYSRDGSWTLSGYVRNMFDEQTYDSVDQPTVYAGYGNISFIPADPRVFGITLSANF